MLDKLVNGIDCGIRAISEVFAGPVYGSADWKRLMTTFWWRTTEVS